MDLQSLLRTTLMTILGGAAAALAPILVGWAIGQLKKVNLAVTADQQARLEYLTKQAILKAEEVIAARVKAGTPQTGLDKLTVATGDLMQTAGISSDAALNVIHRVLPTTGLGAAANPTKAGQ